MWFTRFLAPALVIALVGITPADEPNQTESSQSPVKLQGLEPASANPKAIQSGQYHGRLEIGGEEIRYRGRVASLTIARDEADNADKQATFVFTEYTRLGVKDKSTRPITFCFNGGPGSASLWLHLGGLSPRRIALLPDELNPTSWELQPNPWSIIDRTDLVFIDPVSTGFSRPEKHDHKGEFHGYENDLATISEFIRRWTAEQGRWSSPQFILGESYGGIRGVAVANHLRDEHNYQVEGVILVSPVIDFQTIRFSESNDLPYILFLPSYTATAYHHGRIDVAQYPALEDALKAAEKFALGPYASALLQGDRLGPGQRKQVIAKLSELTGLAPEYIDRADLRISMSRFGKELLREEGRIIGRFDGRFSSPDWDGNNSSAEFDPSGSFISGAFTEAMQQHYFDAFKLRQPIRYAASGDVHPWDYSEFEGRYANAADQLRECMTQQPHMRLHFCLGYTDLATPYMGSLHTISHLDLAPELRRNISTTFYDAGHMMYLRTSEQERLKADLDQFYRPEASN